MPLAKIETDVLILGGGIAGLSCATALAESGVRVLLLEKGPTLGGRARSWGDEHTGDRVDIGPHVILTEYPNFLAWLTKLGTRDQVVWQEDKVITLLSGSGTTDIRSRALPAPLHLLPSMLGVRDVSMRDKLSSLGALRLGMRFLERDVEPFDAVNAHHLLQSLGVSRTFIDWFWRSATMALMNVPLEACSSGALLRFFRDFLGRPDGRFGFPACALDELFVPGAQRFIADARSEIRANCAAITLTHDGDTCTGAISSDGSTVTASRCVCALPPSQLREILPERWRNAAPFRALDVFQPSPYVSTYLWFDRKLTAERFWTRTWTPAGFNYDSYDLSNIRSGWHDRGSVIASNMIYATRAAQLTDEEIVQVTLGELAEFLPGATREHLAHQRVHRIPMAIPCPHPGTERARPNTTVDGFRGLMLAGDWTRTELPCSMESAARSGLLAAEAVLKDIRLRGAPNAVPTKLARRPRTPSGLVGITQRLQGERPPLTPP